VKVVLYGNYFFGFELGVDNIAHTSDNPNRDLIDQVVKVQAGGTQN